MKRSELTAALQNVLNVWPRNWPGIPMVFESCIKYLGDVPKGGALSKRMSALRKCSCAVAERAENLGLEMKKAGREPAYHSRLHTALALVSLTALLLSQRKLSLSNQGSISETEYLLMLTMLSHDIGHPGGRNSFPEEIEKTAIDLIRPILKTFGISKTDRERVEVIILRTDPRHVPSTHDIARTKAFNIEDNLWQCVLIQEADVMASALPQIGTFLTSLLAEEWGKIDRELSRQLNSLEGRVGFLERGALFSSPASYTLGIPDAIEKQLKVCSVRRQRV